MFFLVNIFAIFQTWIFTIVLKNYFLVAINTNSKKELISHVIGVCVPVFTSYFGHKYLSFNDKFKF